MLKFKKLGPGVADALVAGGFLPAIPQPAENGEYDLPLPWGGAYVNGSWYYQSPNGCVNLRLTEGGELLLVSAEAEKQAWAVTEPENVARRKAHDEEDPSGSYPVG